MRDRQFGLLPRALRRSRLAPSSPKSKVGKALLGHHMRQSVPVFDARGEDLQGRIRAKMLRRELRAVEPDVRAAMRERLGREPTRRELATRMEKHYRAAKKAARHAA